MSQSRSIQVGSVLSRAAKALGDGLPPLLVVSLLLIALPEFVIAWLVSSSTQGADVERLLNMVDNLTLAPIAQGALTFTALKVMQSGKPSTADGLAAGVRLWGPVLGISLLAGLGALLGLVLLIVPGIFLAIAWSVAIPIRIDGKPGVSDALTKSFEMTRGSRWQILAVWLIVIVAAVLVFAVMGALAPLTGAAGGKLVDLIIVPLVAGAVGLATALTSASVLEDLKLAKGVGSASRTADIFS